MFQDKGGLTNYHVDNPESVADHTFSMAVMRMIISDLKNLNSEKNYQNDFAA